MTGSAINLVDFHLLGAIANRDTIIPCSDFRIRNRYSTGSPYVNAIRVQALLRCCHGNSLEGEVLGANYVDMKLFAVQ